MQVKLHDLEFELFIPKEKIQARVLEMSNWLNEEYEGKNPLFLVILTGAYVFAADLIRSFKGDCEIVFIRVTSYDGLKSSGTVNIEDGYLGNIEGRDVVILEDIIDSGRTMHYYLPHLKDKFPGSIKLLTLLFKKEQLVFDIPIDEIGFNIPSDFVVGYGLDYNGLGRNLDGLYRLIK